MRESTPPNGRYLLRCNEGLPNVREVPDLSAKIIVSTRAKRVTRGINTRKIRVSAAARLRAGE
jgi:hypothetical protein